jgi:hypothetical protein
MNKIELIKQVHNYIICLKTCSHKHDVYVHSDFNLFKNYYTVYISFIRIEYK